MLCSITAAKANRQRGHMSKYIETRKATAMLEEGGTMVLMVPKSRLCDGH